MEIGQPKSKRVLCNHKLAKFAVKISMSTLEQFTFSCGQFWLVGTSPHSEVSVLRGHKSAQFAAEDPATLIEDSRNSDSQTIKPNLDVGPWFVLSCLLLPVVWGMIVHQIFQRLRQTLRPLPRKEPESSDYQI